MPSLREYNQKRALLEQLQSEIDSFEHDPEFKADLQFREEIKAIQKKYDKSDQDVMDIINPPALGKKLGQSKGGPGSGMGRKVGQKPALKVWRNPHTGEEVRAKSLLNKRLREWCDEHGKEEVRDWVVQEVHAG